MTVPNLLTGFRLVAAPGLIVLGVLGEEGHFVGALIALLVTDWVDGPLARALGQGTDRGARLDSAADATLFGSLLVGLILLEPAVFRAEWPWVLPAVLGYLVAFSYTLMKFRTAPSYHTWSAKAGGPIVLGAALGLVLADLTWPLRVAGAVVALANLEAILLTWKLDAKRSDVRSILDVVR